MKNKILKQLLLTTMISALTISTPSIAFAENNSTNTVSDDTTASDAESTYQQAQKELYENFAYDKAEELYKTISDYKNSADMIKYLEKIKDNRVVDGKFYWQPQEYVILLKQNLLALQESDPFQNIAITDGTVDKENGTTDTITLTYDVGNVYVILYGIEFNDDKKPISCKKIEVKGDKGSILSYPATAVLCFTFGTSTTVDKGTDLLRRMAELNPHGEFTENGLTYIFNNDGTNMSFIIEPELVKYTDSDTITKVQQALNDNGYDCGTPDGQLGGKTTEAINKYQTDKGIDVNGAITDELLISLGLKEKSIEGDDSKTNKESSDSTPTISTGTVTADDDIYTKAIEQLGLIQDIINDPSSLKINKARYVPKDLDGDEEYLFDCTFTNESGGVDRKKYACVNGHVYDNDDPSQVKAVTAFIQAWDDDDVIESVALDAKKLNSLLNS